MKLQRRAAFGWPSTSGGGSANPTYGMAVHYEGSDTGIADWDHDRCVSHWKATRRFHMGPSRGWSDIGYSFGVCPHYVLEGRGKDRAQAAQPGGNTTWYSCTFMSGPNEKPHPGQVENFRALRAWLMADDVARAVRPHSSFVSTGCPGNILRGMIADGSLIKGDTGSPPQEDEETMQRSSSPRGDGAAAAVQECYNDWLDALNTFRAVNGWQPSPRSKLAVDDWVGTATVNAVQYVCKGARPETIPDPSNNSGFHMAHVSMVVFEAARLRQAAGSIKRAESDDEAKALIAEVRAMVDALGDEPEPDQPA